MDAWEGFVPGRWMNGIDVRDFIQENYTPYDGDVSFLAGPSDKTRKLWDRCQELLRDELRKGGVLAVDPDTPINITSHLPGYSRATN